MVHGHFQDVSEPDSSGACRVWQGLFARAIVARAEGFFESVVV